MAQTEQQVVKDPLKKCRKCKRIKRNCICGRPTKKTGAKVSKLIDLFKLGMTPSQACNEAGVKLKTYYGWIERDKEFAEKIKHAREYPTLLAKRRHLELLSDPKAFGHSRAVEFQLKTRARDDEGNLEYVPTQKVEHSGGIRSDDLTDEQKALLKKYEDVSDDELDAIEDEIYAENDQGGSATTAQREGA